MKVLNWFKDSSGIGLVEVMMGVAISGGLALTVAKLMENSSQATKTGEAKSEIVNLKGIVQNILSNQQACNYTFGPLITQANLTSLSASRGNSVTVPGIKDKTNTIKYSTASNNILPLTITNIYLTNYDSGAGTGDLVIASTFKKSSSMTQELKPARIPINFNINNSNPASPSLVACSVMAVGSGEWLLAGNAGTVDGTDFIGTTDNVPLNFRMNSLPSGRISTNGTFFGLRSGQTNPNGASNTGFGANTMSNMNTISATYNTGIGGNALNALTMGSNNTAVGSYSLSSNTNGGENTAVGAYALMGNISGSQNVAMGKDSLRTSTSSENTAIGYKALAVQTSGSQNTALGSLALQSNQTGVANTAIGAGAQNYNTGGHYNVCMGGSCLWKLTTGQKNVGMGVWAMANGSMTGNGNTAIGHQSGYQISTGNNNITIGESAGQYITTGSNNIVIGYNAGSSISTQNNKLAIEVDPTSASPLIEGDFTTGGRYIRIDGALNVDSTSPVAKLNVEGIYSSGSPLTMKVINKSHVAGLQGLSVDVDHAGFAGWSYGAYINNYSASNPGSYTVGLRASATQASYNGQSRMYGGWFSSGNGNTGYNTSIVAQLNGDTTSASRGAAIWATATSGEFPQSMDSYSPINTRWAGVFVGPLHVTGAIYGASYSNHSDRRLKKNIKTLDSSLEKVSKLRGVSFDWKKDEHKVGKQIGFIAQEVQEVYPEVVSAKKDGEGMKAVNYAALVAPIVEAIKELYQKVVALVSSDEQQNIEIRKLKEENLKLKVQLKSQSDSFEVRMKKLEAEMEKQKQPPKK